MKEKRPELKFAFRLSREKLEQTKDTSAYDRLKWLKEARDFTHQALSKEKLATWKKFRRGEI